MLSDVVNAASKWSSMVVLVFMSVVMAAAIHPVKSDKSATAVCSFRSLMIALMKHYQDVPMRCG